MHVAVLAYIIYACFVMKQNLSLLLLFRMLLLLLFFIDKLLLLIARSKASAARGTFNLPTSNEVAVVLAGDGIEVHEQFDVIVKAHDNKLHRVNMLNGTFEPLHFPLLFPYGELGFMEDMPLAKRSQIPSWPISRVCQPPTVLP